MFSCGVTVLQNMASLSNIFVVLRYWIPGSTSCHTMDLILYSFTPLILFCVPYTLDLLPYYLSIANGAGDVGIFELLIFQCFI